ncbi:MAG TPA: hypothetical protein VFU05_13650 [Cyclobacteriaceae bacterium]|nr:hypothetical protein [Cyclobacteriaceae bacterium]
MRYYLFRKTVFDCKKATMLIIKKENGEASAWEQIQVFYHNIYCKVCRRFVQQSRLLNSIFGTLDQHEYENPSHTLPDQLRNSLQTLIDQQKK